MLKVLIVDDQPDSVADVVNLLNEKIETLVLKILNFQEGMEQIGLFRPDVVILDIWNGVPQESEKKGLGVFDRIWSQRFCPVVVYSADQEPALEVKESEHPFIRMVTKGSGSDEKVLDEILAMRPQMEAVKQGEEIVSDAFREAMKEVAPYAFRTFTDPVKRADAVVRGARRRVAAMMDEPLPGESQLATWEQYLCPPVSSKLLLGDILKMKDLDSDDPASFKLVLTPSCDMVSANGQGPKVAEILVAKCFPLEEALGKIGLTVGANGINLSNRSLLSQGFSDGIVPIPGLGGHIPSMAANLRQLELIPLEKITSTDADLCRVASIDSPFRELVSWAYLQVAGRPGLPERDLQTWSAEINADIRKRRGEAL